MEHEDEYQGPQRCDHGAERALLEACLADKTARITARKHVVAADFYQPVHETIYNAMMALDRHGKTVDPVTLRAALQAQGMTPHLLANTEQVLLQLVGGMASTSSVVDYASIVHGWALRRRLEAAHTRGAQRAMDPTETPEQLASKAVTEMTGIRDAGAGDTSALTLGELLEGEDVAPTWVIPNLMEAGDRLLLTGTEGAGKSALSRQMAVMAAAGLHPFTEAIMPPIRTLIFDVENKEAQVRRQVRPLVDWLRHQPGTSNPLDRVLIDAGPRRLNLAGDRDLARLHQTIDAWQPQLVIMGPMYRLYPKSLNSDDDAHPFLSALDTLIDRGCALVIETHAGHSSEQQGRQTTRNLRPRGSAALLGWPEFGLGLRYLSHGMADLEPWRGHREARPWPSRLRRAPGNRWVETSPMDQPTEREPDHQGAPGPQDTLV